MKLTVHEAQANLAKHIACLQPGDRIILFHQDLPVAEILPIDSRSNEPRPVGLGKGLAEVPDSFFDPLPAGVLNEFDGRDGYVCSR